MKKIIFLSLALIVLSSCCPCILRSGRDTKPFQQTQWSLIQRHGQVIEPSAGSYSIKIDKDGNISAKADCNTLMGKCSNDDKAKTINIEITGSTRAMCKDPEMEREFIEMLSMADHYSIDIRLLMLFKGEQLLGVFQSN